MSDQDDIFIKREHRPELRTALTDENGATTLDAFSLVLPINYITRLKDCSGDKTDKQDKKKEIGKDDKGARGAAGAPGGPVTDNALRLPPETQDAEVLREVIDEEVFA